MVEIVKSQKLAYFPSRKVANTSIRLALKELAGTPQNYWSSPDVPLSPLTRYYARGCYKFAVVRDPVKRFLSAYGNRIHHHRDVIRQRGDKLITSALGLEEFPDIEMFCRDFHKYYMVNDKIRRHFRLQRKYLGGNLDYFDKIYAIEHLDNLAADLSEMAGKSIVIPHLQTGGLKLNFNELPKTAQSVILRFTASDYKFLSGHYTAPSFKD